MATAAAAARLAGLGAPLVLGGGGANVAASATSGAALAGQIGSLYCDGEAWAGLVRGGYGTLGTGALHLRAVSAPPPTGKLAVCVCVFILNKRR